MNLFNEKIDIWRVEPNIHDDALQVQIRWNPD